MKLFKLIILLPVILKLNPYWYLYHIEVEDLDTKNTCAGWRIHICDAPHNETGTDCFDYLKPHYAQNAMFVEKLNVNKEVYKSSLTSFLMKHFSQRTFVYFQKKHYTVE